MENKIMCTVFFPILLTQCFLAASAKSQKNFTTDKYALLEFKAHVTSDPFNNILSSNWSSATSICNWIGISCDAFHRRVTTLDLPNMNLTGNLPPHLGNLSFLVSLNLSGNNFYGHLPSEMGKLQRLRHFDLSSNFLEGSIPDAICSLLKLEIFRIGNNQLTGTIPRKFGNLTKLRKIYIGDTKIGGKIPQEIGNLHNLKEFVATNATLSGPIPPSIGECKKLQKLLLSTNKFTGYIPRSIGNLSELIALHLDDNDFEGEIVPAIIYNISSLKTMNLAHNNLSGNFPLDFCRRFPMLEWLSLFNNKLTGTIPNDIGNCTLLSVIGISENFLKGEIPEEVGKLPLRFLNLEQNLLTGCIPPMIFNISTLEIISLQWNNLSGQLPSTFGHGLSNLTELFLNQNKLSGVLPSSISNSSLLTILQLNDNSFTGPLPNSLGQLRFLDCIQLGKNNMSSEFSNPEKSFLSSLTISRSLTRIDISSNPLNCILPNSFGNLSTSLQYLYADNCKIQGKIPPAVGNMSNLIGLWLGRNDLIGPIPTTIGGLKQLQGLFFNSNRLQGTIPYGLCHLKTLSDLMLSDNQLNGSLPECLANVSSLRALYLDSNKLSSTIPSTFWSLKYILRVNLSSNSFNGSLPSNFGKLMVLISMDLSRNQLLGNLPTSIGDLKDLTYLSLAKNVFKGNIPQSFGGLVSLDFLDLSNNILSGVIPKSLEGLSFLKFFNVSFNRLEGEIPSGGSFRNFSAQSFMGNTALCGLPRFQVAPWSFGSVYNGTLRDGINIAIKVFNLQADGVLESFETECEVLRNIRHRNLIKIISSCCSEDFKGLVLEFMPNGTLEKWLYSDEYHLNILQRLNLMIDVASALEYLHHGHSVPIIHCDLKPSNVLLDEDMVARVGDFGLAKLMGEGASVMQTMRIATIGYMAPEYGSLGMVSAKGDVYSYGILVLETFTKRKPTDKMFVGEMSLKAWVNESLSRSSIEVVDATLMEEEEHFIAKANCVSSVLEVALNCCAETPKVRRNMMDVFGKVEGTGTLGVCFLSCLRCCGMEFNDLWGFNLIRLGELGCCEVVRGDASSERSFTNFYDWQVLIRTFTGLLSACGHSGML
ncbi:hypothetical protein SLEP1_g7795 [Rubroshorea leprosula]|uniref:non-specific serine/threonine protein kinase n=1 Tax=Rubroshorea leprosula TaxID=152421 RepID=A0AAV5I7W6_9ROSI|nr:hypothetical protein SLEP1_g7795 [Rubroshorea leprosula]